MAWKALLLRLQDARDDGTYYQSSHWRTFAAQQKWDAGHLCADCGRKGRWTRTTAEAKAGRPLRLAPAPLRSAGQGSSCRGRTAKPG
jgi:hypothetical protein